MVGLSLLTHHPKGGIVGTTNKTKGNMNLHFTNKALSSAVLDALSTAIVEQQGTSWLVSMPQMSAKDYKEFKKVLEETHGVWHKGKGVHTYNHDPRPMFAKVLEAGCMPKRRPNDYFPTPESVVREMLDYAGFHATSPDDLVSGVSWRYLEPSAGQGGIVDVIVDQFPFIKVDCWEIDDHNRGILEAKGYNVVGGDFLSAELVPVYDWVVMNPPFNGANGGYIEHINRAFDLLVDRGRLVSIVPESFLTGTQPLVVAFRNKVAKYGDWANVSESAPFASVGTKIECCYIKMTKYTDADIKRMETDQDNYDSWTWAIITALECEAKWYALYTKLPDLIKGGELTSKTQVLDKIVAHITTLLYPLYKQECSFRWDQLIQHRVSEHYWGQMVDEYFDANPPLS